MVITKLRIHVLNNITTAVSASTTKNQDNENSDNQE